MSVVEFDLHNLGDQPAVAWGLDLTTQLIDGSPDRSGYGRDGLETVYEAHRRAKGDA